MDNKFPGKDVSVSDLRDKFPLVAKKHKNHYSSFEIAGVKFGPKNLVLLILNPLIKFSFFFISDSLLFLFLIEFNFFNSV